MVQFNSVTSMYTWLGTQGLFLEHTNIRQASDVHCTIIDTVEHAMDVYLVIVSLDKQTNYVQGLWGGCKVS